MRQDEQVDDLFKKGFKPDFSEEIPSEFLSDINSRLDQLEKTRKKKRPMAIWWVTGIFSLVGVVLFAYSQVTKGNVGQDTATTRISSSRTNSDSRKELNTPPEKSSIAKIANLQTPKSIAFNIIQSESKSNNKSNPANTKLFIHTSNSVNSNDRSENQYQLFDQVESSIIASERKETLEESNNLRTDSNNKIAKSIENVDSSSQVDVKIDSTNVSSKLENSTLKNLSQENKDRNLNYFLGFYSGVSSIYHQVLKPDPMLITVVMPYTSSEYRDKRKLEESMLTSWDMGVRFGLQMNKWTLSSGIEYFNWGERTDYSNVSYDAQFKNAYQFVNIPLLVGYQLRKGSYGIQPMSGISMGFLAKEVSGYYLSIGNTSSSYQANISKLTSTFHAGIEFSYFSQSGLKVSLSPIFRQSLGSIVQSEIVKNRYSSLGLQLGIGYRWD
jgi:hypothetical protein